MAILSQGLEFSDRKKRCLVSHFKLMMKMYVKLRTKVIVSLCHVTIICLSSKGRSPKTKSEVVFAPYSKRLMRPITVLKAFPMVRWWRLIGKFTCVPCVSLTVSIF